MGPSSTTANGATTTANGNNSGDLKGYNFESVATQPSAWQAYRALVYIRFIRDAATSPPSPKSSMNCLAAEFKLCIILQSKGYINMYCTIDLT